VSTYVTGTFHDERPADTAIEALIALGYPRESIDVMMSEETRHRYARPLAPGQKQGANVPHKEPGGEVLGAAFGAITAGAAALTIFGTVITGGLALPFVVGPLAALVAAGGGAAAGGFLGAMMGTGVSEKEARRIERDIDAGAIVIGIDANDEDAAHVRLILGSEAASG
jgi:hypothetical protein